MASDNRRDNIRKMKRNAELVGIAVVLAVTMLAGPMRAATLTGDESLTDGVLSYSGGTIGGTLSGNSRTFSWSGVSGGLNLGGYNLTYAEGILFHNFSDGTNLVLDLLNGSEYGAITNGGDVSTSSEPAGRNGGLTITNAGMISVGRLTCANPYGNSASSANSLSVSNKGAFLATATLSYGKGAGGTQSFAGDNTGSFVVTGDIDSHAFGGPGGGTITINGYQSVTVSGAITTYAAGDGYGSGGSVLVGSAVNPIPGAITVGGGIDAHGNRTTYGGNIAMYASGPITITGTIDLNCPTPYGATDGSATLKSGGDLRLGSFDMTTAVVISLDYSKVCAVTGSVFNVDTNYIGGAGIPTDPHVTTQTVLRIPAGRKMIYRSDNPDNAYLNGKSFKLADLSGAAGSGGILKPYTAQGTVIILR